MNNAGLGRRSHKDERDKQFLLEKKPAPVGVRSRYWGSRGPVLDQGGTSQCVIYAGDKYLTASPILNKSFGTNDDRHRVYKAVQILDEWPTNGDDDGTSVRALFKYLKTNGYVSEYRWAVDVETIVAHILAKGPVVVGTSWYMDMFTPDRWGYIWDKLEDVGGHAYFLLGANRLRKNPDGTKGAFRILNSWGDNWADKGRAWITFDTMGRLIRNDGEAAVGIELKR